MKSAGESYVAHVGGFQTDNRSISGSYMDTKSAQLEKRSRIDLQDLKEQGLGEAHIFFKSRIIRAKMFYANPQPIKEIRLNQFVKVDCPSDAVLRTLVAGFESFKQLVSKEQPPFQDVDIATNDDVSNILNLFKEKEELSPIERGINTLLSYHKREIPKPMAEEEVVAPEGQINIFTKLTISDYLQQYLLTTDKDNFSKPILLQQPTHQYIEYVERSFGKTEQYAANIAMEFIKDMQAATLYPPVFPSIPTGNELTSLVGIIIDHVALKKKELEAQQQAAAAGGGETN